MAERVRLENVGIVLHRPRFPENIGSAARAACNMGIGRLDVVDPECFDPERIRRMATHAAGKVVDGIRRFDTLAEALADRQVVVGTTARLGGEREKVTTPERMARRLVELSAANRVALVFGPEDRGLTNEDLRLCHELVTIPTAQFASLNLAQAVVILCYEVFRAEAAPGTPVRPKLAARHELDGMYDQLREMLVRISFINPQNPDYWMNRVRRFGTRMELRAREVSIIRGICRQVDWYGGKRYADGFRDGEAGRSPDPEPGGQTCD
jgi:tRNA/rRNA methyltransferase